MYHGSFPCSTISSLKKSSGKSTISNFIFFIPGGDFNDFVPEAKDVLRYLRKQK